MGLAEQLESQPPKQANVSLQNIEKPHSVDEDEWDRALKAINLFKTIDKDGSGEIDLEEFTEMLLQMGVADHERKAQLLRKRVFLPTYVVYDFH